MNVILWNEFPFISIEFSWQFLFFLLFDFLLLYLVCYSGIAPEYIRHWFFRSYHFIFSFFQQKKFYPFRFSQIDDNIYVGNIPSTIQNFEGLKKNEISGIIILFEPWESPINIDHLSQIFSVFILKVVKYDCPSIENIIYCINFINRFLHDNQKVLICCPDGNRRSLIIVISYLMIRYKFDFNEALHYIEHELKIDTTFFSSCRWFKPACRTLNYLFLELSEFE